MINRPIFEQLYQEAEQIQSFLDKETLQAGDIQTEGTLLREAGDMVENYIVRTNYMMVQAQYILDEALRGQVPCFVEKVLSAKSMSAKLQNTFIETLCPEERNLLLWIDRINNSCKYRMRWYISKLSYLKTEINLGGY